MSKKILILIFILFVGLIIIGCPTTRAPSTGQSDIDTDGDDIPDIEDKCPGKDDNLDADNDDVPDGCDICPGEDDNLDSDGDGIPDGCDDGENTDTDGDGVFDEDDNCINIANDQTDADGDGYGDECDNCPDVEQDNQSDFDGDGWGDECDNCPAVGQINQQDSDGDGEGDACEQIIGVCDGVTHGTGESYIEICIVTQRANTVKITITGNGLSESQEITIDSNAIDPHQTCVTATINTYGTYNWSAIVIGDYDYTTAVSGTIIVNSNNQSCTDTGQTDTDN